MGFPAILTSMLPSLISAAAPVVGGVASALINRPRATPMPPPPAPIVIKPAEKDDDIQPMSMPSGPLSSSQIAARQRARLKTQDMPLGNEDIQLTSPQKLASEEKRLGVLRTTLLGK